MQQQSRTRFELSDVSMTPTVLFHLILEEGRVRKDGDRSSSLATSFRYSTVSTSVNSRQMSALAYSTIKDLIKIESLKHEVSIQQSCGPIVARG